MCILTNFQFLLPVMFLISGNKHKEAINVQISHLTSVIEGFGDKVWHRTHSYQVSLLTPTD